MIVPLINEFDIFQTKLDDNDFDISSTNFMIKNASKNASSVSFYENEITSNINMETEQQNKNKNSNSFYFIKSDSFKSHNFSKINKGKYPLKLSISLTEIINQNDPSFINHQIQVEVNNTSFENTKHFRKKFSEKEDNLLKSIVKQYGAKNWKIISSLIPGRSAKQCRDRYSNYLAPFIDHSDWEEEEDQLLIEKYLMYGPKWTKITQFFPNRTANSIKNRYNYTLSRRIDLIKKKKKSLK